MIGEIVNATTLDGWAVQGRLVYQSRRVWGPRPDRRVALLVDVRPGAPRGYHYPYRCMFVCEPSSVRRPMRVQITVRA